MRKLCLLTLLLLIAGQSALFAATNVAGSLTSNFFDGGPMFCYGFAYGYDYQLKGKNALSGNLYMGAQNEVNAAVSYGTAYTLGLNFEYRYYLTSLEMKGFFAGGFVNASLTELPGKITVASSYVFDYTTFNTVEYGIRLGYHYHPLEMDFFGREIWVSIIPYATVKQSHHFDEIADVTGVFWYGMGITLSGSIASLYSVRKLEALKNPFRDDDDKDKDESAQDGEEMQSFDEGSNSTELFTFESGDDIEEKDITKIEAETGTTNTFEPVDEAY